MQYVIGWLIPCLQTVIQVITPLITPQLSTTPTTPSFSYTHHTAVLLQLHPCFSGTLHSASGNEPCSMTSDTILVTHSHKKKPFYQLGQSFSSWLWENLLCLGQVGGFLYTEKRAHCAQFSSKFKEACPSTFNGDKFMRVHMIMTISVTTLVTLCTHLIHVTLFPLNNSSRWISEYQSQKLHSSGKSSSFRIFRDH